MTYARAAARPGCAETEELRTPQFPENADPEKFGEGERPTFQVMALAKNPKPEKFAKVESVNQESGPYGECVALKTRENMSSGFSAGRQIKISRKFGWLRTKNGSSEWIHPLRRA